MDRFQTALSILMMRLSRFSEKIILRYSRTFRAISRLFDECAYDALQINTCANGRKVYGSPSGESVKKEIEIIEEFAAQGRIGA